MTIPDPFNPGKLRGLTRLADERGHFTMLAADQRPPIAELIAHRRGIARSQVGFADIVAVKRLLVQTLAGAASAVLIDPNFGFPAAFALVPRAAGLVVTLEDHRFEDTPGGRLSQPIREWSVEQIRRTGADAVKVLAWYRPDAETAVREHQQRFVRTIGEACRRADIAFVLELLVYPFAGRAAAAPAYVEAPDKHAALVLDSLREFARPEYGVDLFKLESPLPAAGLPERDGSAAAAAAQRAFDELGALCSAAGTPWVMLSAGATAAQFERVMAYACAAGASGFLAGRAIWWSALAAFPDLEACRAALEREGLATLRALAAQTRAAARPWRASGAAAAGAESNAASSAASPASSPAASALRFLDHLAAAGAEGELCAAYARTQA